MKRAATMAFSLMLAVSLAGTGAGTAIPSYAAEAESSAQTDAGIALTAETDAGTTGETTVIQPRTETEAGGSTGDESGSTGGESGSTGGESGNTGGESGNTGGESGSTGGESGSTGGESGSTGGESGSTGGESGSTGGESGSTGGESGSTGGENGSTGGSTGSTESGGSTGGTGSTESGGSTGGSTGSTESGGSTGGTGSTESGGSTGGSTGSTENSGSTGSTGSTESSGSSGSTTSTEKETTKQTEKKPSKQTEKETTKQTEKETTKETTKETAKGSTEESQTDSEETQKATQAIVIVTGQATQTEAGAKADEEPLYSEYLGTGGGWEQLTIVQDESNAAADYEFLLVQNTMIICTQSDPILIQDETQPDEMRTLTLSAAQISRLASEKELEYLVFEVDQSMIAVQLEEFLSEDMSKLIAFVLDEEAQVTEETLQMDFASLEAADLSEEQLEAVQFEVRVLPLETEDGIKYDISIWMCWEEQELEISSMLPSLAVAIDVEGQYEEENRTDFVMEHSVEWTDADGMVVWKASALVDMPYALTNSDKGSMDRFTVQMTEESEVSEITYVQGETLESHSHSVLMAGYAGWGTYGIS